MSGGLETKHNYLSGHSREKVKNNCLTMPSASSPLNRFDGHRTTTMAVANQDQFKFKMPVVCLRNLQKCFLAFSDVHVNFELCINWFGEI